jgi:myosin heavy subunit
MVLTKKMMEVDWVCCDDCARWDMFDNVSRDIGLDKFDGEKIDKLHYVCRQCKFESEIRERFNAFEGRISGFDKLRISEEIETTVNQQKNLEQQIANITTEMYNLKESMKEVSSMKELQGDVEELKNDVKESQALIGIVSDLEEKLKAVESFKEELGDVEEIRSELTEIEKLKKSIKEMDKLKKVPKEVDDLKKAVKDAGDVKKWLKDVEKDLIDIKKEVKEVAETKKGVDSKLKIVEDLKKDIKKVEALTKGVDEVKTMKEQLQKLNDFALSQSDNTSKMDEFVEVRFKGKVKEMKAEVAESMDIEQRKLNVIIHGVEEDAGEASVDNAKVMEILNSGLKMKADNHLVKVCRIGKPSNDRPRLLKVELKSLEGKIEVLKRAKNLRHSEDFKKVFIVPDLTRKQQLVDKELRDQVKKFKSQGMQHVMISKGQVIKNEEGKKVVLYCPTVEKN